MFVLVLITITNFYAEVTLIVGIGLFQCVSTICALLGFIL